MPRDESEPPEHVVGARCEVLGAHAGLVQRADQSQGVELPQEGKSGRLASPRAILIAFPLLVLAVGLALTLVGQDALTRLSTKMTMQRFDQETELSSHHLRSALSQADAVLTSLPELARDLAPLIDNPKDERFAVLARDLLHLGIGRPGVTQVYLGFPSGDFISARLGAREAPIELTRAGVGTSFTFDAHTLKPHQTAKTGFDPTKREWFKLGTRSHGRVWTEPYTFFQSGKLGVTQVLPIFADAARKQLLCVAGVDFDVTTLTAFLRRHDSKDLSSLLFSERGIVLAYPSGQEPEPGPLDPWASRSDDATLRGFFGALRTAQGTRSSRTDHRYLTFNAGDEPMLAAVRPLTRGGPRWQLATFSRRKDMQSALLQYRRSSLLIGGLALLASMLAAWAFARFIIRQRQEAVLARAAARAAQKQVLDLGSYTLVSRLGAGGMGEVWRARHHLLAREAAIKLIRTGDAVDGPKMRELEERFRREARALAALRSRNTIELFDYGLTSEGTLYYVMELLDGIDLQALVERFGPQPAERVRRILIQACNSLGEAHEVQLVHRDIKPANIFLCRAADEVDVVKVLDFGLVLSPLEAVRTEGPHLQLDETQATPSSADELRLTQVDMQLGTPGFMSPEQALGGKTDARADVYSLGCVAWWLLTGQPLYAGETAVGVVLKHIQARVPDLQEVCPSPISPEFTALIHQCLEKHAKDRPQDARELLRSLKRLPIEQEGWTDEQAARWWVDKIPKTPSRPAQVSERPYPALLPHVAE